MYAFNDSTNNSFNPYVQQMGVITPTNAASIQRSRLQPSTDFAKLSQSLHRSRTEPFRNMLNAASYGSSFDARSSGTHFNPKIFEQVDTTQVDRNLLSKPTTSKIIGKYDNISTNPTRQIALYDGRTHQSCYADVDGGVSYIQSVNAHARSKVSMQNDYDARLEYQHMRTDRHALTQEQKMDNAIELARSKQVWDKMKAQAKADDALYHNARPDRSKYIYNDIVRKGIIDSRDTSMLVKQVDLEDAQLERDVVYDVDERTDVREGIERDDVRYRNNDAYASSDNSSLVKDIRKPFTDERGKTFADKVKRESQHTINSNVKEKYEDTSIVAKVVNAARSWFGLTKTQNVKEDFKDKSKYVTANDIERMKANTGVIAHDQAPKMKRRTNGEQNTLIRNFVIVNGYGNELQKVDKLSNDELNGADMLVQYITDEEGTNTYGFVKTSLFMNGAKAFIVQQLSRKDHEKYRVVEMPADVFYEKCERLHDPNYVRMLKNKVINNGENEQLTVSARILEAMSRTVADSVDVTRFDSKVYDDIIQVKHALKRHKVAVDLDMFENAKEKDDVVGVFVDKAYDGEIGEANNIRQFNKVANEVKMRGRVGEDKVIVGEKIEIGTVEGYGTVDRFTEDHRIRSLRSMDGYRNLTS